MAKKPGRRKIAGSKVWLAVCCVIGILFLRYYCHYLSSFGRNVWSRKNNLKSSIRSPSSAFRLTAVRGSPYKAGTHQQYATAFWLADAQDDDRDDDTGSDLPILALDTDGYDENHDGYPFTDFGDSRDVYHEIYSLSKSDRRYYNVHMDGVTAYNANLIPHPTRVDMWLVVATHMLDWDVESLFCSVGDLAGLLVCAQQPKPLAIAPSLESQCEGEGLNLAWVSHPGPRDLRLFWGPDAPYVIYGSPSQWACLGMWIQDARTLLEPYQVESVTGSQLFHGPVELQRPRTGMELQTRATIEKNFFLFWDENSTAYVHYDIWPQRSFAKLDLDGSVGEDLAALTSSSDRMCLLQLMPILNRDLEIRERIHQATNSLAITLCKRQDPYCKPDVHNTFIMHIFQRQRYNQWHNTYQPYVVLFRQTAPFDIYGISEKALWIHGRSLLTQKTGASKYIERPESIPDNHSEMLYVTSMSWKNHGQRYHGYLDDPIWIGFGREDSQACATDVLAEDIVRHITLCEHFG